ncbi:MAG: AAA family ATPase [Polyangiales bacterium]
MLITHVSMQNFCVFEDATVAFKPGTNALIGPSGCGKTAVLAAIGWPIGPRFHAENLCDTQPPTDAVLAFGRRTHVALPAVPVHGKKIHGFTQSTIFSIAVGVAVDEHSNPTLCRLTPGLGDDDEWFLGRLPPSFDEACENSAAGGTMPLPLYAQYMGDRLWRKASTVSSGPPQSRIDGNRRGHKADDGGKAMSAWMQRQIAIGLQMVMWGQKPYWYHRPVVDAVRAVVPAVVDICADLAKSELIVELDDKTHARWSCFDDLGDGLRSLIGLVADIAWRTVQLNPHWGADAPARTSGVVLIDVLEKHLHPEQQQGLLDRLRAVFPKLQFIVTTHSPYILHARDLNIIDLPKVTASKTTA